MKNILLAASLLMTSINVQAIESIQWNSIAIGYIHQDFDTPDLTGYYFSASELISNNVFIIGDYSKTDANIANTGQTLDKDTFSLGLGYRHRLSSLTDSYAKISYRKSKNHLANEASKSIDGIELELGVRTLLSESIEVGSLIGHSEFDSSTSTYVGITSRYHYNDNFALSFNYQRASDEGISTLAVVLSF